MDSSEGDTSARGGPATRSESPTLLIVSADDSFRAAGSSRLADWRADLVVEAESSGEAALDRLATGGIDCVVVDHPPPGGDGSEIASRLSRAHGQLPVIVRTATPPTTDDEGLFALADDFVRAGEGPGDVEELAIRIEAAMSAVGQTDKIEALHDAATDVMACHSREAVYEETVAAAERILEFDMCCTMIDDEGMLRPMATSSGAPPDGARPMDPDQGAAGYVYQNGEPHVQDDTRADDVSEPAKESYRSGMTVPIGDVGVFQAVSTDVADFSREDVELAELLLSYTEAALDGIAYEETLQEERDRFWSLFELSTDAISDSTLEGEQAIVRRVNPAFEEVFGCHQDEIVGERLDDFVTPPGELDEALDLNRRSREGERIEREVTRQTPDGPREFLLRSVPYELGEETRCFAVYTDITEQKRIRRRFRALIEHSSDIITVLESDGTIAYQSPSIERILGYDPADLVGENAFDYVHPEDRPEVMEQFNAALENPEWTPTVEYRFRHEDGSWHVIESIGRNRLEDPAVEGFVVNSRDATERKQRLQRLEALPGAAMDLAHAEEAGRVAEIAVETAGEVLGLPIAGLWLYDETDEVLRPEAYTEESVELFGDHPVFTADGDSLAWEAFEAGESRVYGDLRTEAGVHNPDTIVRSEMMVPLGDHGVMTIGSTVEESFSDVDVYFAAILAAMAEAALERIDREQVLRRQRRELRRQNEQLDRFANVVSHDLRNPLNLAVGHLDLLRDDRQDERIERIDDALERMERIIDDVLTLARQGGTIGAVDAIGLGDVVAAAWAGVATGDGVLETAGDGQIRADYGRLQQLFENLFRNAVEHAGPAPTVEVGLLEDADGDAAAAAPTAGSPHGFFVEDDGPGIPPDVRDEVFESGVTTAPDGTGFGLAIVRQIVEAHGWEISVVTGRRGGARFEITGVEFER